MGCLEQYYTCTKMKVSGSSTLTGAWGCNNAPPPLMGPLVGERGSRNAPPLHPPPHTAPKEGGPSLHQGGGCSLLHTPQHPPTMEPHLCPTVVPSMHHTPLISPKPRGGGPYSPIHMFPVSPPMHHTPLIPPKSGGGSLHPHPCVPGVPPMQHSPLSPQTPRCVGGPYSPDHPPLTSAAWAASSAGSTVWVRCSRERWHTTHTALRS